MPAKKSAKVTGSRNRSTRSSSKPVTKGQNPQRANRQRTSTARVTSGSSGKPQGTGSARVTSSAARDAGPTRADANKWQQYQQSARTSGTGAKGAPGTKDAPKNATGTGARNPRSNVASANMRRTLRNSAEMRNAAKVAQVAGAVRGASPAAVAYETLKARPTAAGTVTAAQSGRAPSRFANARDVAIKKASAIKGSPVVGPKKSAAQKFDSAFAAAKKAGKKEFTWKGKKYTTEMK